MPKHSGRSLHKTAFILMINKKRTDVLLKTSARFIVRPMRIELISSEPESGILSIELRAQ